MVNDYFLSEPNQKTFQKQPRPGWDKSGFDFVLDTQPEPLLYIDFSTYFKNKPSGNVHPPGKTECLSGPDYRPTGHRIGKRPDRPVRSGPGT